MNTLSNLKMPRAVCCGEGALKKMPEILQAASVKKAAVFTDKGIRSAGLLFYNTLFDENAACHLALSRSVSTAWRSSVSSGSASSSSSNIFTTCPYFRLRLFCTACLTRKSPGR